jgi:histidinol dehydrogenase
VADFVKRISLIALGVDEGRRLSAPAALLADGEGLTAHAAAARARIVNSEQSTVNSEQMGGQTRWVD